VSTTASKRAALPLLLAAALLSPALTTSAQAREPSRGDLERVFGPDGSVLVSYDELLRLIRGESSDPTPPRRDPPRPNTPTLVGAAFECRVEGSLVRCAGTLDIDLVGGEGWTIVPLGLDEAALTSAEVGGQPAVVGALAELARRAPAARKPARTSGYGVLLSGKGRRTLRLELTVPYARTAGRASFQLRLPATALNRVTLSLDEGSGPRARGSLSSQGEERSLTAFYPAAARLDVTWTPRSERAEPTGTVALDPLLYAETDAAVKLEEGVLHTDARISYRVHQAPIRTLRIALPPGATFLSAQGVSFARYPQTQKQGERQIVTIELARPTRSPFQIDLRCEQLLPEGAKELQISSPEPLGTERNSGRVAVRAARFLRLEPRTQQGLSKLEVSDFPHADLLGRLGWQAKDEGQSGEPPLVFRYPRQPWSLEVVTRQVQAEVSARLFSLGVVRDDEIGLATTAKIEVRERPVFDLSFALPANFALLDIANSERVRDHRVEERGDQRVLVIQMARPLAVGQHSFTLFGSLRRANEAGALARVEPLRLLGAKKQDGLLGVAAASHLQLSLANKQALWPLSLGDLARGGYVFAAGPNEELAFGFRHGDPAESQAEFNVSQREPRVRVERETLVDFQEDQVRVASTLRFQVDYAGVQQVRLRGPRALKDALVFAREGITGSDVAVEGDEATWTVSLQGKRQGRFTLRCSYKIKLDGFAAGQQKRVTLAPLEILDCARQTEDIALRKHENLVLSESGRALVESRHPRELAESLRQPGTIRAYRVQGWPYQLSLLVTKYDFRAPEGILIRHLHQAEVVEEAGGLQAEAIISVQNRSQQYLRVQLPPGAEMRRLKVDGRAVNWRQGDADPAAPNRRVVLIDLGAVTRSSQGAPFQVRMRYKVPAPAFPVPGAFGSLEPLALAFPLDAPKAGAEAAGAPQRVSIARHTRTLYLPQSYAYLSFDVEGTKHFAERGVWSTLTGWLRALRGQPLRPSAQRQGARAAEAAIARLSAMGGRQAGVYEPLDPPRDAKPYLFERLDGGLSLRVTAMAWPLFYLLDFLILAAVIVAGFLVDKKQLLPSAWILPLAVVAVSMTGGAVAGRAFEPFFAAAFLGGVGLIAFFLLRGVVREVTERQAERNAERTEREAQVARARAQAAEAEATLQRATAGGDPAATGAAGAGGAQ